MAYQLTTIVAAPAGTPQSRPDNRTPRQPDPPSCALCAEAKHAATARLMPGPDALRPLRCVAQKSRPPKRIFASGRVYASRSREDCTSDSSQKTRQRPACTVTPPAARCKPPACAEPCQDEQGARKDRRAARAGRAKRPVRQQYYLRKRGYVSVHFGVACGEHARAHALAIAARHADGGGLEREVTALKRSTTLELGHHRAGLHELCEAAPRAQQAQRFEHVVRGRRREGSIFVLARHHFFVSWKFSLNHD